jgi:CO dehydrogenase/acetyl-CoA synthase beta subunit
MQRIVQRTNFLGSNFHSVSRGRGEKRQEEEEEEEEEEKEEEEEDREGGEGRGEGGAFTAVVLPSLLVSPEIRQDSFIVFGTAVFQVLQCMYVCRLCM